MAPRVVRVLPDVPALAKEFDYLVPEPLASEVEVGAVVRVALHGRRVRGWVVADGVEPLAGVRLQPIAKVTGLGPSPELIELARWAAWRWAGRAATLLRTATPEPAVRRLPPARPAPAPVGVSPAQRAQGPPSPASPALAEADLADALSSGVSCLRLAPATDLAGVALAAAGRGNALVLCPSIGSAREVAGRLRRAGVSVALHPRDWAAGAAGATVVGTRSAAWARVAGLAAVVVLDEHDESHRQEQAPTWHARDLAVERARRAGVPCVLTSPCPTLEALAAGRLLAPSRGAERAGWPPVVVADRRGEDPRRAGLFSPALLRTLHGGSRVLCVLNRTGRARLLACAACGEVARCDACGTAVAQPAGADVLACRRCAAARPPVCLACRSTSMKVLRAGAARAREELEALLGEPVVELSSFSPPGAAARARVVVGTEAALHQAGRADTVAFLDLDAELLAPRYRASEQALGLLARAAAVVGRGRPGAQGGRSGGQLLVQTRLPGHEVVQAAVHADPGRVARAESARRAQLGFPPAVALALVSGPCAAELVTAFGRPQGVEVLGPSQGRWLLRAADHGVLCDALAATPRPAGRVRVEVDPLRV